MKLRLSCFILVTVIIFSFTFNCVFAEGPDTSAAVKFSVKEHNGIYTYTIKVTNTSQRNYDLYFINIGIDERTQTPFPFGDIFDITPPTGWIGDVGGGEYYNGYMICFSADWDGSVDQANNYMKPGESKVFVFSTNRLAPKEIPFFAGFYNNNDTWGFVYNGIAKGHASIKGSKK